MFEDLERMRARLVELTDLTAGIATTRDAVTEAEALYAQVDGLGFVLGTVGAACGANLFVARRVGRGLEHVALVVTGVLARHQVALTPSPDALPSLRPGVGEGWELPLLFGALLQAGGARRPGELRWSVCTEGGAARLVIHPLVALPAPVHTAAAALAVAHLPGLSAHGGGFRFPARWLEEDADVSHEGR